ncbi:TPA: threonylcarbamoyl-AMP synthase [candidate division CPR2 bacterium]|uniref:L-threonylcarbamoyladenylate synthase n=1 Tax=candidate division CPR2 bacterium GW2011_GWC1_41_48 TaxID=1618344 RepID=A0A0G0WAG9_UNCC2|nr:MAG: Protein Sua5 [candidate division CPR2 bacterium GW2011_GWC2_39_35]KKR28355.1 MAG: Protein Sua5 [candidate division CPR2 bacterium GW2011_GWD2_39_7]KKR28380.1 MAG: Protein Sua5 [candidate division CPR2 bacterium GW2011_GWD1_39_7]KKS09072.1 MAG: Protein Sua5 [candidate division CPR2 bacterium GW2011_GWC1_41_48]OGB60589.1 MAG: threonylcarbamoyl-AMP synthase [candidate division CPR2 bacterium GWD1_39_7]OGB72548.1 MAG: threonylcarbamoyl-AMP synthase [candidate division CPR2 bacterium GWD2_3
MSKILENHSEEDIRKVVSILKAGGTAIFPTDTVYGIGASMCSNLGLKNLYQNTERPEDKPTALLIDNISWVKKLVAEVPEIGYKLMTEFWPGALTIIFKASKIVPQKVAPNGKVGLRLPGSQVAEDIIKGLGCPIATKSANIANFPTPGSFEDIEIELLNKADVVIRGEILFEKSSTVLDISEGKVKILREGVISQKLIKGALEEI